MRLLTTALALALLAATPALAAEKLRIATTSGYPPFNYVDDAGEIAGFDVDIALALCEEIGAECEIVLEEWERLIPELRAGSFDAIAASMSITEKRRQLVSFTERYYSNLVRFVARKGSGFDPADAAGTTIGAARATIASDWLEANLAGTATIKLYAGQEELYGDLVAGRLDAMFGDGLGSHAWLQGAEGAGFEFVGEGYRLDEGIGIAVHHEDASLLSRLNGALEAILANGAYERINARYFPFSIY
ncbi:MAG: transporter substrate-binding domain-containing protein [Rhodospirillales bacterium]|nr:transporter substrate-binding domain-containing protein [Rhodospirillales bacterium]MDE0378968.1 transporter substrate-binding domain-containing protein [Rhodospirillales bacterium]